MAIELVPLATARVQMEPAITLGGTPWGNLLIVEFSDVVIEGERLKATLNGNAAADWMETGPEGTGILESRYCVATDDGALISVSYSGRCDLSRGLGAAPVYATPLFQTGDQRYAWLNKIQAVAKGIIGDGLLLTYEIYELR